MRNTGLMLAAAFVLSPMVAGAQDGAGYGTVKPYTLTVEALKGPVTTDVYLTVKADGVPTPTTAKKIQLKSLDELGDVRWVKNTFGVPLRDGVAAYAFDDLARHLPLNAQVHIKTPQSKNEEVLKAGTIVMLRPDLTIESLVTEPRVRLRQPVNVEVVVRELNQDLGATFDGCILEGDTVLDAAYGASIDAGGTTSLVFTLSFDVPGIHTLKAVVKNVEPGEYTDTNNTHEFQIEVLDNTVPVSYWLSYYDQTWDNAYTQDAYWGHSEYASKGSYESAYFSTWHESTLNWPVEDLSVSLAADGEPKLAVNLTDIEPTWRYQYADQDWSYDYGSYYTYVPGENAWIYLSSYDYQSIWGNWQGQSFQISRYAGDYVYQSSGYYSYWGYDYSWDYSYVVNEGTFWHARQGVTAQLAITDDAVTYGGSAATQYNDHYVQPRYEWDYCEWWGCYSGHYEYEAWSMYGYGMTQ